MKTRKLICALAAALSCLFLFACTPTSISKAKDKMKKEGYTIASYTVDDEAEDVEGAFIATKVEGLLDTDMITAILFKSTKAAKNYMKELGENTNAIRDGKWVYFGTEDAIEDFTD